jgi:hypothetical protein
VQRPRRGFLVVIAGVALLVALAVMLQSRDAGDGGRVDRAPAPAINRGSTDSVGTTGSKGADGSGGNGGPAAAVPPAIIQELGTITGTVDGHELIGRRVDLHVPIQEIASDVAFWVGEGDNRVLVVMGRDDRDGAERQRGLPSSSGVANPAAGQQAAISGTVRRLPNAEEMHSWQLTRDETQELLDRRIYVRADSLTPEGHAGTH